MVEPSEDAALAGRRGKRIMTLAFITFATVFVLSTTYQVMGALFSIGARARPESGARALVRGDCTSSLRALSGAVDRAVGAAARDLDESVAAADFRAALEPEWGEGEERAQRECAGVPGGDDAYAAVLRLRRAGEGLTRRQVVELGTLRRDVSAYLPAPPPPGR